MRLGRDWPYPTLGPNEAIVSEALAALIGVTVGQVLAPQEMSLQFHHDIVCKFAIYSPLGSGFSFEST